MELEAGMNAAFAASRAKSEFLADMSHELRRPMNGLLGMLDLVLDSKLAPAAAELRDGSHVRVLLVEDNLVNQKLVLAVLKKKGFHIDVANDGHQALSMLAEMQDSYSVVLMDVQMPVMDGMETTRQLRSDPRWEKLPVIAMTAHAMNGDRERRLEAGMNAYIAKPVQPGHLISTIEKQLVSVTGQLSSRANS